MILALSLLPTDARKPAWRAARVSYREKRRAGAKDYEACRAAVAALQAVWPLSDREVSVEVARCYCLRKQAPKRMAIARLGESAKADRSPGWAGVLAWIALTTLCSAQHTSGTERTTTH